MFIARLIQRRKETLQPYIDNKENKVILQVLALFAASITLLVCVSTASLGLLIAKEAYYYHRPFERFQVYAPEYIPQELKRERQTLKVEYKKYAFFDFGDWTPFYDNSKFELGYEGLFISQYKAVRDGSCSKDCKKHVTARGNRYFQSGDENQWVTIRKGETHISFILSKGQLPQSEWDKIIDSLQPYQPVSASIIREVETPLK